MTQTESPPPEPVVAEVTPSVSIPVRILAACAVVGVLYAAAGLILPIVTSLFLFYALDPLVDRLQSWRIHRLVATLFVMALAVGGVAAGGYALWPQVAAVVEKIPDGVQKLRQQLTPRRSSEDSALTKVQEAARAIDRAAAETMEPAPSPRGTLRVEVMQPWRASDLLWAGGVGVLSLAAQGATVLFLTLFLLVEDDSFKRKLVKQMETLGNKRLTVQILNDIASQMQRFIWVQAVTSAGVALSTWVVLWWMGVEQAAAWAVFAGVFNIVPYFGPLVVTVILAAVGFLQFGTVADAVMVGGSAFAITMLEGTFITPHLLSRTAALNHVAIFVSIAFWSWLWGVVGTLLAVPLLMAFKAVCDHVPGLQNAGEFLGD